MQVRYHPSTLYAGANMYLLHTIAESLLGEIERMQQDLRYSGGGDDYQHRVGLIRWQEP